MLLKYVIGSSSAALLRFLAFLLLVKAVGVDDYGIIAFYLSIATIASTLAPLGTYNNTIRRAQENEKLSNILYYFLTPSLAISLIFLIASYFLFDNIELMIYIYFSELFKTVLPSYMYAIINTTGNQVKSAIIQFVGACISMLVSIEIYFIDGNYVTWAQHYFIGGLFSFLLTIIWLRKIYIGDNNIQPISMKELFHNIERDKWNTFSIISRTVFFNIDRIILNYILPQYIYGIYSICIRLTASVYLLISNTIHYYESHFFKYGKEKNILEINKLYESCKSKSIKTISVMFLLQVVGILILYLFFNFTLIGATIFSEL
ncbi:oligosaccharide flippase family protein, partial [Providencia sp. MGF014]|uniref:oligosaccharide flippase family protein n=1 Tax=Providencia sp. MGF014 TaxID=2565573 RepID=UPI00109C0AFD